MIGISPTGAVVFVSDLYPGSISDKELTRRCGIIDMLDKDDAVMADRGFDIEEDLILRGVKLNIPDNETTFFYSNFLFTCNVLLYSSTFMMLSPGNR